MNSRQAMGNLPKALEAMEESLRIKKIALGPDHHAVGAILNNIGNLYHVCTGCGCFAVGQAD